MKDLDTIRRAVLIGLALAVLAGCTTPTPLPSPVGTPTATPPPLPSPSATATPRPASVDLGVPAGDTYNVLASALDSARGLVYAVGNEGDARTDAGVVAVVDLEAGRVQASASLPVTVDWTSAVALSADGARLYVAGRDRDARDVAVVVATGVDGRPLGEVLGTVSDVRALALDATGGHLYVANDKRLRRLNALSLEQEAATDAPDALSPMVLLTVSPRAGRVYLCDFAGNGIFAYRADDLTFVGMLEPGAQVYALTASPAGPEVYATVQAFTRQQSVARVVVIRGDAIVAQWDMGEPYYSARVAASPDGRVLVLQDGSSGDGMWSRVQIRDAETGAVLKAFSLPYANLTYSAGVVYRDRLVRVGDVLFTADLDTGEVGTPLHLGVGVVQMALDADADSLHVLDSTGVLHAIDLATMARVRSRPIVDTGLESLSDGPMTAHGGRLYVADVRGNRTLVLDAATGEKVGEIPKAGQVSVDEARKRLFVTRQGVFIADAASYQIVGSVEGTVREEQQLYSPGAVEATYDPTTDRLYVIMTNNAAGSGARTWLDIYDAKTLARLETPIQSDQRFVDGLALDGGAGSVWVAANYPRAVLSAWSPDGRLLVRLAGLGGRLFLDAGRGRLYARAWGGLAAVDTATGDVVGFRPLSVRFPDVAVFDEGRGCFYVAERNSATVQVVPPGPSPVAAQSPTALPPRPVRDLAVGGGAAMLAAIGEAEAAAVYRREDGGWVPVRGYFADGTPARVMAAPGTRPVFFAFSAEGSYSPSALLRSTDGGRSWQVSSRGLTDFYIRDAAFSPDFATDGTAVVLAGESGLFRTTDGGETWAHAADIAGVRVAASAGPCFVVLSANAQYSSTDVYVACGRDGALQAVGAIPVPPYFVKALALSPEFSTDGVALAAAENGGMFRSQDGGRTWESVGPPLASLVSGFTFVFAPDFSANRTVYALASEMFYGGQREQRLLRSTDGGANWEQADGGRSLSALALGPDGRIWAGTVDGRVEPLAKERLLWAEAPAPTPTFTPPPPPTPAPTPTPLVPLMPPTGLHWPDGIFSALWRSDEAVRQALGWASEESAHDTAAALEAFERGIMLWRQDVGEVYVLFPEGDWYAITDTWTAEQPESDPAIAPPEGRFQPVRGFGKVWRENQWLRERLGWAVEPERGVTAQAQRFEHGWLLRAEGSIYALVNADIGPAFWQRHDVGP